MAELALHGRPPIPPTNDCSLDFGPEDVDQEPVFRAADYQHSSFTGVEKQKSYEAWPRDVFQSRQHPVDVVLENFGCHQEWERRFLKKRSMSNGGSPNPSTSNSPSRGRCFTAQPPPSPPRCSSQDGHVEKPHPRAFQTTRKMKLMLHSNGYGRTFLVDTPKSKVTRGIAPRLPPTSRTGPAFLYFGNPDSPSTRMQPSSEPCRSKSTIPTVSYARAFKSSTPAPAKSSTTKKADAAPPYSPPLRPWSERKAESNDVLDKILGRFDITMDCIVESFGGTSNTNEE